MDRGSEVSGSGKEATGALEKGKKTTGSSSTRRGRGAQHAAVCALQPPAHPQPGGQCAKPRGAEDAALMRTKLSGSTVGSCVVCGAPRGLSPTEQILEDWVASSQGFCWLLPAPDQGSLSHSPAGHGKQSQHRARLLLAQERGAVVLRSWPGLCPCTQLSPGQPQVRSAAGKEPSGEAIQCEEKPISCSPGCFAQRFTKFADATALPRWDINTKPADVDECPTATQTLLAVFSLERKKGTQEEQTAVTPKALTVAVQRLGLQAAGKALPWARHSAQATTYSGMLTQEIRSWRSYCGSTAEPQPSTASELLLEDRVQHSPGHTTVLPASCPQLGW